MARLILPPILPELLICQHKHTVKSNTGKPNAEYAAQRYGTTYGAVVKNAMRFLEKAFL